MLQNLHGGAGGAPIASTGGADGLPDHHSKGEYPIQLAVLGNIRPVVPTGNGRVPRPVMGESRYHDLLPLFL